jgi:O-methyltransferase involved in polyketide biosynthesis
MTLLAMSTPLCLPCALSPGESRRPTESKHLLTHFWPEVCTELLHTSAALLLLAEGLVYYLPPAAVQQLLRCISSISAPGSRLQMDFLHLSALSGSKWNPGFETLWISVLNKGEQMHSGIDERPAAVQALMSKFGFHTYSVKTAADLVKEYMPHVEYKAKPPIVSPYFGYLSAEKL